MGLDRKNQMQKLATEITEYTEKVFSVIPAQAGIQLVKNRRALRATGYRPAPV
jgi:hypothetical protein